MLYGRYRIVELLGQGGMATIYRGHDSQLGRDVAIKVLRSEYGRDPGFVARFRQEAQSAAVLNHPTWSTSSTSAWRAATRSSSWSSSTAATSRARIAARAAGAGRGRTHRPADLRGAGRGARPRNRPPRHQADQRASHQAGRVKVADFGIARAFSEAQLTMPGTTLGSVHYFSPEQARGEMVTSASDIYSAGLVLFEMLTGRRAWTGDSAGAVAVARLTGDPPCHRRSSPGIPAILDEAVARALARIPADRPTAGEMAALLGRFIADPKNATGFAAARPASRPLRAAAGAVAMDSGRGGPAGRQERGRFAGDPARCRSPAGISSRRGAESGYHASPPRYHATADQYAGGPAYGTVRGGVAAATWHVRRGGARG